jgi:hypothetical protein
MEVVDTFSKSGRESERLVGISKVHIRKCGLQKRLFIKTA